MKNKHKNKKGFSLIEVLFTLLVLTVGIGAVVSLLLNNIRSYQNSRDQIIATLLAQEGAELVRNLKDNKHLDADVAFCNYTHEDAVAVPEVCSNLTVDRTFGDHLSDDGQTRLFLDAGSYFVHTGITNTRFYRRIDLSISGEMTPFPSTRIITAVNYVTWHEGGFASFAAGLPGSCTVANQCVSVVSMMPDTNN